MVEFRIFIVKCVKYGEKCNKIVLHRWKRHIGEGEVTKKGGQRINVIVISHSEQTIENIGSISYPLIERPTLRGGFSRTVFGSLKCWVVRSNSSLGSRKPFRDFKTNTVRQSSQICQQFRLIRVHRCCSRLLSKEDRIPFISCYSTVSTPPKPFTYVNV